MAIFYFQGFLFSKNEDGSYSLLDQVSQAIDHKAKSDVTKEILQKGSDFIVDFIATNASKKPQSANHYTYEQIKDFEGIAKESVSLYHSPELKDGVYNDYQSLKDQQPNKEISRVKFYGNAPKIVRIYETVNGEEKEIKRTASMLLFTKVNFISIFLWKTCLPKLKKDNDYYFTGK
jgi:hypothetical protein